MRCSKAKSTSYADEGCKTSINNFRGKSFRISTAKTFASELIKGIVHHRGKRITMFASYFLVLAFQVSNLMVPNSCIISGVLGR
ncbi:hypothetical protein THIOM_002934 [Candidatus Thiomargarita nelsonii]|uniref:Uncharacterized protein n=1 Tax=Candidatus Thiomargarita nelsonii TaxID=1003181 RepID=A0A176RZR5_9GAMM|nr:hypothetical protein THIOM_002934 [Candidatus Thiomargarita nelsonii]